MAIIPSFVLPPTADARFAQGPQVWGDPNSMFNTAQQLLKISEAYIAALETQAGQLAAPTINPSFPVIAAAPTPATAQQPALIDVTWNIPTQPAPFNGTISPAPLPGPFNIPPPTLIFPAAPAPFNGALPAAPGLDLNFTYPSPSINLPSAPQLFSLDNVDFSPFNIPAFNVTVPQLNIAVPNVIPYQEGALFTSSLLTTLEANLQDALDNGSWTGLPPNIETSLFDRAREREYKAQADAKADLDRMETMGWALPPGVWIDAHIKLMTETHYTLAGLSREIMVKQAELVLENTVKARSEATALESKLIDYANQVAQRAFEATKYATEASIALYNGAVRSYEVSLKGYETQALVYDTQIKGILANVEVLKAHIEFEKVKTDINTALIAQYKASIEAQTLVLEVAKTQLQIIETQANVQKLKVEIFGEQIKAFVGEVNAYQAQIDAYKALVSTQGVIEDVYKTQVEAYAATVNAGVAEVNANVAVFRGQVEAYQAQLAGFKAAVESMVGQATAASQFNTAEAEVYRAAVAAISSYNDTLTKQWEAVINEQEKIAEIAVQAAKANGDLYIAARGLSLDASKVGAQVSAQLGAAALGAIHWANNSSWAIGINENLNSSQSTSTTTNTNTNISV
jgi:hypothetical protein